MRGGSKIWRGLRRVSSSAFNLFQLYPLTSTDVLTTGFNMTSQLIGGCNGGHSQNASFDNDVVCDGINPRKTRQGIGLSLDEYNAAVRFPLLSINTFWPNQTNWNGSYSSTLPRDTVRVDVSCLRPDQIKQGSTVPPSGKELLDKKNSTFSSLAAGLDAGGNSGMLFGISALSMVLFLAL